MKHSGQMNNSGKYIRLCAAILSLLFVLGCSSNSSNDDPSGTPTENPDGTLTGAFVDSPVSGLSYITSSGLSGTTNAAGEFLYLAGDAVTFAIGALELGTIAGSAKITPFDLAGYDLKGANLGLDDLALDIAEANLTDTATKFEQGVNMMILLQSLDRNNNPDDGIEIANAIFVFFTTAAVTLLFDSDTRDFVAAFLGLFLTLVTDGILDRDADDRPVDRDQALTHFLLNN